MLGVTHLSVVMEMRGICESGPGNLNMQVKVCCNTLSPLMCLLRMRPWDQLDGSSSLQPRTCTPSFCTHQPAALHTRALLLYMSVLLTQWWPACCTGKPRLAQVQHHSCLLCRQTGRHRGCRCSLNNNMLGRQVECLLYLRKKQQICHGCSVSPDEDGGLLEEGNLVAQVQALQVHNLHHTVGPLLQDARLHLSCIQQVPPCLVRPVHNCHPHWLLTGLQCTSLPSHSMLKMYVSFCANWMRGTKETKLLLHFAACNRSSAKLHVVTVQHTSSPHTTQCNQLQTSLVYTGSCSRQS